MDWFVQQLENGGQCSPATSPPYVWILWDCKYHLPISVLLFFSRPQLFSSLPLAHGDQTKDLWLTITSRLCSLSLSLLYSHQVPVHLISIFNEFELEQILCGLGEINICDWRKHSVMMGTHSKYSLIVFTIPLLCSALFSDIYIF